VGATALLLYQISFSLPLLHIRLCCNVASCKLQADVEVLFDISTTIHVFRLTHTIHMVTVVTVHDN